MNSSLAKPNWILRHWRGEESLGIAYWRNSILLANITPALLVLFYQWVDPLTHSLQWDSTVTLVVVPLILLVWAWGIVGALRSANRHTSRGGSLGWANIARGVLYIAVIGTTFRLYNEIPALKLLAALATDHDPMPKAWVYIVENGKTLWLQGTLGEGSAEEVRRALVANPQVTTVVLSSRGGRAGEANQIAHMIGEQHLDTTVRGSCMSACTYVLLAGRIRTAPDPAKVGFHRATFPGLTTIGETSLNFRMFEHFRSLGLPSWFVARAVGTPPTSMWYPTHQELLEARVLSTDGTWK